MYPDWPESAADLVPLPHCDGPKLKPFVFQGPQKIEFLEYLGDGLHSHVFKIKVAEQIYALKLFRFVYDEDWICPEDCPNNLEAMSAFYNYAEPFSAECRAFGRLQEAGHEDLAVRCFGYLLLDEEHERRMRDQFGHLDLEFNGNGDYPGREDMRSRFLGRGGRPPPLRGIVKALGRPLAGGGDRLGARDMRRLLRDVVRLQQLGIVRVDVADRQVVGGRLCDLSTAVTVPHFVTTPELNPRLAPEWVAALEFETFQFSINDYWDFDEMVRLWNEEHDDGRAKIAVHAFPGGDGLAIKYNLRSTPSRERLYSLVDPRRYDWRASAPSPRSGATRAPGGRKSGRRTKGSGHGTPGGVTRRKLDAKPPRWYYDCKSKVEKKNLREATSFSTSLEWEFRDGLIYPRKKPFV